MTENYTVTMETFKRDWPFLVLVLAMFAAGVAAYPYLPEQVPSHWNINGEVDAYSSRFWGAFGVPLMTLGVYALMVFIPLIDPKRNNYVQFLGAYRALRGALVSFFVLVYALVLAAAFGVDVPIGRVMPVALGPLFVGVGWYIRDVRFNYFVGIRTPWTLADEEVWRETHRVSSRAFMLAGLTAIISALLPAPLNFWVTIGAVGLATVFSVGFSYFAFAARRR